MSFKETTINVPVDLLTNCSGLALDFGEYTLKAVYRSEDNLLESESLETPTCAHLQAVLFSRSDIKEGLEYIRKHATQLQKKNGESNNTIAATGLSCTQYGKVIASELDVKLQSTQELRCFVQAFVYLAARLSREQLFEQYDLKTGMERFESSRAQLAALVQFMFMDDKDAKDQVESLAVLGRVVNSSSKPIAEAEDDLYPCMLAICGSALHFLKVAADGTFSLLDGGPHGGGTLHGLGSLLTDCTKFEDLMDTASKGNARKVDLYSDELFKKSESSDNVVEETVTHIPINIYSFGRCTEKSLADFRREDLARALLDRCIMNAVQVMTLTAQVWGIRRIVVCGALINTRLIRTIMTSEFVARNYYDMINGQTPIKFDFVVSGEYLGAIGALLTEMEVDTVDHSLITLNEFCTVQSIY